METCGIGFESFDRIWCENLFVCCCCYRLLFCCAAMATPHCVAALLLPSCYSPSSPCTLQLLCRSSGTRRVLLPPLQQQSGVRRRSPQSESSACAITIPSRCCRSGGGGSSSSSSTSWMKKQKGKVVRCEAHIPGSCESVLETSEGVYGAAGVSVSERSSHSSPAESPSTPMVVAHDGGGLELLSSRTGMLMVLTNPEEATSEAIPPPPRTIQESRVDGGQKEWVLRQEIDSSKTQEEEIAAVDSNLLVKELHSSSSGIGAVLGSSKNSSQNGAASSCCTGTDSGINGGVEVVSSNSTQAAAAIEVPDRDWHQAPPIPNGGLAAKNTGGESNGTMTTQAPGNGGLLSSSSSEEEQKKAAIAAAASKSGMRWSMLLSTEALEDAHLFRASSVTDAHVLRRKGRLKEQDGLIEFIISMHATHSPFQVRYSFLPLS